MIDAATNLYAPTTIDEVKRVAATSIQSLERRTATRASSLLTKRVTKGNRQQLVVLVQWNDRKFKSEHAQKWYDRLFNEPNFRDGYFTGSVRDYFLKQSDGQYDVHFDVMGPITVSQNHDYYGQGANAAEPYLGQMMTEACMKLPSP